MKTKLCPFCKEEKPIETFQKSSSGKRVTRCNQCKYKVRMKQKTPTYVSMSERVKLNINKEK